MDLLKNEIGKLKPLCKKYHVSSLYAFGSVLTKKFNKDSDIDLLVYFEPIPVLEYADNFFDFMHELKAIFKREIDLVSGKAMKNPYFIEEVERNKQLIYGNHHQKITYSQDVCL